MSLLISDDMQSNATQISASNILHLETAQQVVVPLLVDLVVPSGSDIRPHKIVYVIHPGASQSSSDCLCHYQLVDYQSSTTSSTSISVTIRSPQHTFPTATFTASRDPEPRGVGAKHFPQSAGDRAFGARFHNHGDNDPYFFRLHVQIRQHVHSAPEDGTDGFPMPARHLIHGTGLGRSFGLLRGKCCFERRGFMF